MTESYDSSQPDSLTGEHGLPAETLQKLTPILRTLQIIIVSLVIGPLVFLFVIFSQAPAPKQVGMLTIASLGMTALMFVARAVVPSLMVARARRRIAAGTFQHSMQVSGQQLNLRTILEETGQAGQLMLVYQIRTIICGALIEGATFFLLVAHMIEGSLLTLIAAVALMLLTAAHFPTRGKVSRWIARQLESMELDQLRDNRE